MKNMEINGDYLATFAALGEGGNQYKCIVAMELYLSGGMTIHEAANVACASVETQAVADAIEKGFLTRERAKKILIAAAVAAVVIGVGIALYQAGAAITAAKTAAAMAEVVNAHTVAELQAAEHPVSIQTQDALLEEVLGYLDSGADALEEYLPPVEASELQERDQVKALGGEDLTLAVNTMVLYTMAQNGELPPMPGDGSLAQTAIGVCGEDLMRGIRRDEQSGYVRQEETTQRRCALLTASRITLLQAGAALAGGLAALTLLPLGLLGTLGTCGALLAAVGAVMTEKFRNDSRMLADEADELPRLSLELPHRTAPWSSGSRERTSRADVSHEEAEQAEVRDVSEEFLFRPF